LSARSERAVWIGLGVLVAAAVILAVANLKREEREIDVGYQGEARGNPWLAAERFLAAMGLPARRASGLAVLPPRDHMILLALPGHELDGARSERLLDWVEGGGHVIATATGSGTSWADLSTDPLLTACAVAGEPVESGKQDEVDEDAGIPSAFVRREERQLSVHGERRPLRLLVRTDVCLRPDGEQDTADGPVSDAAEHPVVATCRLGEGRITVLADLLFATNAELGERDHARLLWRLATLDRSPAGVWLVRRDTGPSLAGLVFGRGLPLAVALGLLGVAAAVRAAVRFGPPLPLPPRGRRSLLEHVEAVGALLWRRGRHDVLLSATRMALTARASARRPELQRLQPAERIAALAAAGGVESEALRVALEEPCTRDPEPFVRAVRTLQTVRRSL
jgi:hypothetical protein